MAHNKRTHYGFCKVTGTTLCVENHLIEIAKSANTIVPTLVEVEKDIIDIEKHNGKFNEYIEYAMKQIATRLPTHHYSHRFFNQNNIDQTELIHLLKENHNAMMFYYNSINDILESNSLFRHEITSLLRMIPPILKDDVICNYQLVLRIYSNNQHNRPLIMFIH
ncbi:unnamed protein product [Rotaria sordida]|uniref:Uncharacterized protein n=2 Tax=Rotaria sordida TaxID=392033 RepID=A0A815JFC2_9BILA|nr:unnamed protein product [Rotaria sordida]CAF3722015.1 unnamed protein product [Rotaria sordida]